MTAPSSQAGFTLLEVLIALAIVSVALAASVRALGVGASGAQAMQQRSLALQAAREPPGRAATDAQPTCTRTQDRTLSARPAALGVRATVSDNGEPEFPTGDHTDASRGRPSAGGTERLAVGAAMTQAQPNQQGFTLLEVLVALALMALLSVISWRALDMVDRSRERLNASADDTLGLVRVLGQIESDISRHAGNDILTTATPWDPAAPTSAQLPPGIIWHEPVLTVLRSAHDGSWQQVSWGMEDNTLRRAVGQAARTLPLPQPGMSERVLGQVDRFMVRGWVPGQGWSSLDANNTKAAATGLEIVIARHHNGVQETYRKVVLLP